MEGPESVVPRPRVVVTVSAASFMLSVIAIFAVVVWCLGVNGRRSRCEVMLQELGLALRIFHHICIS